MWEGELCVFWVCGVGFGSVGGVFFVVYVDLDGFFLEGWKVCLVYLFMLFGL